MEIRAALISNDKVFARMLNIEMSELGIECDIFENSNDEPNGDRYGIVLADLDFCGYGILSRFLSEYDLLKETSENPEKQDSESDRPFVIGWTFLTDFSVIADSEKCSFILHRPFLMSDMRSLIFDNIPLINRRKLTDKVLKSKIPSNDETKKISQYGTGRKIAGFNRNRLYADSEKKAAVYGNERIPLSDNEFKILDLLCRNRGETVTRKEISDVIGAGQGNMGDVYICFLRKKIEGKLGLKLIYTVRGTGYVLK